MKYEVIRKSSHDKFGIFCFLVLFRSQTLGNSTNYAYMNIQALKAKAVTVLALCLTVDTDIN